jgi:hypothetical protein
MNKKLLLIIPLIILFIIPDTSFAQLKKGSWLWTLNVGYVPLENKITANSISGWTGSTTLEKLIGNSSWSIGGNLAFFSAHDSSRISDLESTQSFSSSAFSIGTKYYVDSMGDWVPYIGLGIGFISTSRYTALYGIKTPNDQDVAAGQELKTSIAFITPVGINYFPNDELYLGLNLTTVWQDETYFKSSVNLLMNFSVGFQIN